MEVVFSKPFWIRAISLSRNFWPSKPAETITDSSDLTSSSSETMVTSTHSCPQDYLPVFAHVFQQFDHELDSWRFHIFLAYLAKQELEASGFK